MSGRSTPTYDLAVVQKLVRAGRWATTWKSVENAGLLKFDRTDIEACVGELDEADFYKTMASETVPGTMQDVYKPTYLNVPIYLKLQLDEIKGLTVVIQFKRDQSR